MKKMLTSMICCLLLMAASGAQALTVTNNGAFLNEFGPSGSVFTPLAFSGLGSFERTYTVAGDYTVLSFIDNELDFYVTGFDPEFGGEEGVASSGFFSRLDDPYALWDGFVSGDTGSSFNTAPADVAAVMGWQFTLLEGQQAVVNFSVSEFKPTGGHFLFHNDAVYLEPEPGLLDVLNFPDSSIYYMSSLEFNDIVNPPIPEPSTLVLFGTALVVTGIWTRRRRNG